MADNRRYSDRREYLKQSVTDRRKKLKLRAVELLGGECTLCGYNKYPSVLDFHHIDPQSKSFGISSGGQSRSWFRIAEELMKCILVCANCHREIENGHVELDAEHLQSTAKQIE